MARERDIVVGRRGDSLTGKVREKHFEIKSDFGSVKVPTEKIAWIHFRNPPPGSTVTRSGWLQVTGFQGAFPRSTFRLSLMREGP